MDAQALVAAGLLDPDSPTAEERRELLAYLVDEEGCSLEELLAAERTGRLFALAGDRQIRPLVGLVSLNEAAEQLGADAAHLRRVWRASGLPDAGSETPLLTPGDVEALQTYLQVREFLGEDTALGVIRVVGASLARITEAVASAMRQGMESIDVALTGSEVVTARSYAAVCALVPRFGRMLDTLHRQHLEATRVHFEGMDIGERAAFRCGVGFADLSGFTRLAEQVQLRELAQVLAVFEDQASETVQAGGGRIVKFLGDAVMWVAADPDALVSIAHDLVHHPRAAMEGIDLRAGVAYGRVLAQDGDYFGPPVNLAARLVAKAEPGQVVTCGELLAVMGDRWSGVAGEETVLRGFSESVRLHELQPA